jgi:hypothetical protein
LGTLFVGGQFMSRGDITAGDLMSFLVATQTVERFVVLLLFIDICCFFKGLYVRKYTVILTFTSPTSRAMTSIERISMYC